MTTTTLPALLRNAAASLRYARLQRERERRQRPAVDRETLERGRDCLAEQQDRAAEIPAP